MMVREVHMCKNSLTDVKQYNHTVWGMHRETMKFEKKLHSNCILLQTAHILSKLALDLCNLFVFLGLFKCHLQ